MKKNKPVIVGVGELLWDMLPTGKRAGGAPVNFVYHEPGCAVLHALEEGLVSESRYKSYLNILEDKNESKYREEY